MFLNQDLTDTTANKTTFSVIYDVNFRGPIVLYSALLLNETGCFPKDKTYFIRPVCEAIRDYGPEELLAYYGKCSGYESFGTNSECKPPSPK